MSSTAEQPLSRSEAAEPCTCGHRHDAHDSTGFCVANVGSPVRPKTCACGVFEQARAASAAEETHSGGRVGCNHEGGICSDVDRVADAIARKKGSGPLHLMPASSAGQYRAMARAALDATADMLSERMDGFYKGGVHTRAGWAVAMLRMWASRT